MNKTEQYFKAIQKLAFDNLDNYCNYLDELNHFLATQDILKKNKVKTLSDKLVIFFIEYIEHKLEHDFVNNNLAKHSVFDYIYIKISDCCVELKSVASDSILIPCLSYKKSKIKAIEQSCNLLE